MSTIIQFKKPKHDIVKIKNISMPEILAKMLYTYDNYDYGHQRIILNYFHNCIISILNDDAIYVANAITEIDKQPKEFTHEKL